MLNIRSSISRGLVIFALPFFVSQYAAAEDEAEEGAEAAPASAIYLPLKPSFVVNYGAAGRLKYLKVDVSVRVSDSTAANSIRHHLPYIRNNLVMLFARQSDESLSSFDGKEQLRKDAGSEIKKVLLEQDGLEGDIVDVYFDSLIVQK